MFRKNSLITFRMYHVQYTYSSVLERFPNFSEEVTMYG